MSLVFVPLSAEQLRQWATTGKLAGPITGHAVTDDLKEAFGVAEGEDAERVALLVASVAGLVETGQRVVAVAESEILLGDGEPEFGEVLIGDLDYRQVGSLFADEPGLEQVSRASAAVAGLSLSQAWDHPLVADLLGSADLLWHGAGEWDSLTAG